ncbi:MAG TPA: hypothetical protein VF170_17550 [Planctomycetaceae bacterium]
MEATAEATGPDAGRSERRRWLIAFLITPVIALAGACVTIRVWREDLSVPFEYDHDGLMVTLPIKTMVEQGWWFTDPRLGAPARLEWYDFPVNPTVHLAIIKAMSLFEGNAFRLVNYYVLLGFPLIAVCALAALRAMRLPPLPAAFGSLIFAFAPYHFWRGQAHLWLGVYFTVPLGMIVLAWVLQDRPGLLLDAGEGGRWRLRLKSWRTWAAVLCCAALGLDFPYYPVFTCFLLLVAGPYVAVRVGSWRPAVRAGAMIVAIAGFFALNLLPNILYRLENGPNEASTLATVRPWYHSEMYGLKIASLLMPPLDHPIPALEALRVEYQTNTVVRSAADSMSLGTLAAGGFLSLLAWTLFRLNRGRGDEARLMDGLSVLNLACLLLATVGGLGAVANLLSIRAMRCYDRASIVIMFLAVVPVCLLLAAIGRRTAGRAWARSAYVALVCVLTVGGVWEQSRYFRITDDASLATFQSDREFVKAIEAKAGADAKVFQYPVQNFLSQMGPAVFLDPYSHFRGFMHSDSLTWSMGAVVGRHGAKVQSWIAAQPTDRAVEAIGLLGFDGIYVDRKLYRSGSETFEKELRDVLNVEPVVSPNGRLAFYPMADYVAALESRYTPEQLAAAREQVMRPVVVELVGFDGEEKYPTERYRWCQSRHARLRIDNAKREPITVELNFSASTARGSASTLRVEGPSLLHNHVISVPQGKPISHRVTIPPGEHFVEFITDAAPLHTRERTVYFRLNNFDFRVEGAPKMALWNETHLK